MLCGPKQPVSCQAKTCCAAISGRKERVCGCCRTSQAHLIRARGEQRQPGAVIGRIHKCVGQQHRIAAPCECLQPTQEQREGWRCGRSISVVMCTAACIPMHAAARLHWAGRGRCRASRRRINAISRPSDMYMLQPAVLEIMLFLERWVQPQWQQRQQPRDARCSHAS